MQKVVIACHYPFFIIPFFLPLKTYVKKSYIAAFQVHENKEISVITVSNPVTSIRYHTERNKYLIYLNGSHNICNKYNNKENFNKLLTELNKSDLRPKYIWSNQDLMTEDKLPYIGYIDENLLIGTGYNTWGMTNGSLAGKIISDLLLKKDNIYIELFNPKRNKKLINLLKYSLNISCNAKSYIENKLIKNKSWYNNVVFKRINGKNIAIYTDENGIEHKIVNLCPHMKCSLIFNEIEKTWDCPCHGSRFDLDGKVIFGPSKKDIAYRE